MSKLLLVAPAFVFPLVYLVSKLFGHRIPSAIDAFKLSDDEAFTTLVVMGISEHSAVLWTPLMRIALVEGRDQGAALTLAIACSLFMATFLAKNFSWGFLLQLLMTGSVFGLRVHEFLTSDHPDLFASYLMAKSAVVLFGGLLLGILVVGLVERIGRWTPWPNIGSDPIATFIVAMVPISGIVDYWFLGILESGAIVNLFA
jgi:hypothetical protein